MKLSPLYWVIAGLLLGGYALAAWRAASPGETRLSVELLEGALREPPVEAENEEP